MKKLENCYSKHPLYSRWEGMIGRCYRQNQPAYKNYGGRGIKVCDRWRGRGGFLNFLEDMGELPSPKHSLDRIDVNADYTPENCRWATWTEQSINKRQMPTESKSGYWGVEWSPGMKKWIAFVAIKRRKVYLGSYKNKEEAALAHDMAALKSGSKAVRLNFPDRKHEHAIAKMRGL